MRIREGSQVKTGMAVEKETKGIDYQTWEFTLPWFRLESYVFTRIGKTGFRGGKRSCTTVSGI